jgi:hypothetical protein
MAANYVLLAEQTVSQTVASVTFSNIPQTGYTDLVIKGSARSSSANIGRAVNLTFNSSGSNKRSKALYAENSITGTSNYTTQIWFIDGTNAVNASANTFSSFEIYVPDYRSAVNKSLSIDTVTENNGVATMGLSAGLWTDTAAISSITIAPESGSFILNSSFSLYGVAALGVDPVIAPKASGGDIVVNDGTYWYHAFLSTGSFIPSQALTCDVLVVAGGGQGSSTGTADVAAGGGGAGGVLGFASQALASGTNYNALVGAGGTRPAATVLPSVGGNNSIFGSLTTTVGGGYGGYYSNGGNGGSGGGAGGDTVNRTGGTGTSGQGNNGGNMTTSGGLYVGGGGGGAGAVGASATSTGGAGGAGVNTVTNWGALSSVLSATGLGVSGYIAGGGGGGGRNVTAGAGGSGGGGAGGQGGGAGKVSEAVDGVINTGSGGGGGGSGSSGGPYLGGNGGSGMIIVRYTVA